MSFPALKKVELQRKSYIEKYVGLDLDGVYRDATEMGTMYFMRTLEEWSRFDINNRTKFDAAISSGLAIMACNKNLYRPNAEIKREKVNISIAKYKNKGMRSKLIE